MLRIRIPVKAASHCSDAESCDLEPRIKFPEDLMEAFLNTCLDDHIAHERIQWISTVWLIQNLN